MVDAHGKVAWGRSDVEGAPIVVLLTEQVSQAHLAGLREDGVGYLFAGKDQLDLPAALGMLGGTLGIEHLLLEGGGHMDGAFLRAGLVDEISLMLVPAIDRTAGAPAVFDGADSERQVEVPVSSLSHEHHELLEGGIVWLRYQVRNPAGSASAG